MAVPGDVLRLIKLELDLKVQDREDMMKQFEAMQWGVYTVLRSHAEEEAEKIAAKAAAGARKKLELFENEKQKKKSKRKKSNLGTLD